MTQYPREGEILRVSETGVRLVYRGRRKVEGKTRYLVSNEGQDHSYQIDADRVVREATSIPDILRLMDERLAEHTRKQEAYRAAYAARQAEEALGQRMSDELDDAVWAAAPTVIEDNGQPDRVKLKIVGPEFPILHSTRRPREDGEKGYISRRTLEVEAYAEGSLWSGADRKKAGVNWSAIGTVSTAVARRYAELIIEAIPVAERITAEYDARRAAYDAARGINS